MEPGQCVRLVSDRAIVDAAKVVYHMMPFPGRDFTSYVLQVRVGDVGTVTRVADDGLFEVRFDTASIVCNDAMVEVAE